MYHFKSWNFTVFKEYTQVTADSTRLVSYVPEEIISLSHVPSVACCNRPECISGEILSFIQDFFQP